MFTFPSFPVHRLPPLSRFRATGTSTGQHPGRRIFPVAFPVDYLPVIFQRLHPLRTLFLSLWHGVSSGLFCSIFFFSRQENIIDVELIIKAITNISKHNYIGLGSFVPDLLD